ncbi:GtrA family protein [Parabacteroides sp. AM08-6]|mgnify:CR=1 FL=1|uniref:GtrA family protein n=1 Tax=Parabacteroides sp. AM08-6 TaxID=2292053 RepID=UPI000EFEE9D0|nr:GtrA family protein [Parabacteroides sp. AM08-6]RHJ87661.1 GtrA family protein [Parabacteroides sp. AM08-6]
MKESVRIIRFILVGTLNALIAALVIWLMMEELDCNYIASNITAYIVAQINNFFWSKYWIFTSNAGKFQREIPLFLLAFGCAYGAQFLALLLMVEGLDLNEYLAQFLGLFVYGAVNFLMNKKVTFLRR